jgi:hypothetical protein
VLGGEEESRLRFWDRRGEEGSGDVGSDERPLLKVMQGRKEGRGEFAESNAIQEWAERGREEMSGPKLRVVYCARKSGTDRRRLRKTVVVGSGPFKREGALGGVLNERLGRVTCCRLLGVAGRVERSRGRVGGREPASVRRGRGRGRGRGRVDLHTVEKKVWRREEREREGVV